MEKKTKNKLTMKQRLFVESYTGNATESALKAGYSEKTARSQGQRLLTNIAVQNAINERAELTIKKTIAGREERQIFWTSIMRNKDTEVRDRLRASELLGKSEGDFLERIDHMNTDGTLQPMNIDISHLSFDQVISLAKEIIPQHV